MQSFEQQIYRPTTQPRSDYYLKIIIVACVIFMTTLIIFMATVEYLYMNKPCNCTLECNSTSQRNYGVAILKDDSEELQLYNFNGT